MNQFDKLFVLIDSFLETFCPNLILIKVKIKKSVNLVDPKN